jgi:hypothetical protein
MRAALFAVRAHPPTSPANPERSMWIPGVYRGDIYIILIYIPDALYLHKKNWNGLCAFQASFPTANKYMAIKIAIYYLHHFYNITLNGEFTRGLNQQRYSRRNEHFASRSRCFWLSGVRQDQLGGRRTAQAVKERRATRGLTPVSSACSSGLYNPRSVPPLP